MTSRAMRCGDRAGASVALFLACTTGCLYSPDDERNEQGFETRAQWIAVGATVELRVTDCTPGGDGPLLHCLPTRVTQLASTSVGDDSFVLSGHRMQDGSAYVSLTAQHEGQTTLELTYLDEAGEQRQSSVVLNAAVPASVGVYAECGDHPARSNDLALGVASTVALSLDPRAANREPLSTGELSLFDFGIFQVLEQKGTRVTLLTPTTIGDHTWTSVAGEPFPVTVFGATSVGFIDEAASPVGSSVTLGVSLAGKTACTLPERGLALVRAEGDCAIGVGGVIVDGSLPLETHAEGSTFEVRGTGECRLIAQAEGMDVAEHRLTPRWPQRTAGGSPINTQPLRFELQQPLGSATCDKGITDGDCEPLIGLIPDADCITDADFKILQFDSRGPIKSDEYIGRNLTIAVSLGITVGPDNALLEGKRAPLDVTWSYDAQLFGVLGSSEDAHVEIGECLPPSGETRLVHVRVDALGPHEIEFEASNINDTGELEFATRGVDKGRVEINVEGEQVTEGEWPIFAGTSATVFAHYERNDGLNLRGDAPLETSSDNDLGMASIGTMGALFVGKAPARLSVRPTVGNGGQTLVVVDEGATSSIEASTLPTDIKLGDAICTQVTIRDVNGKAIRGTGDVPLHARIDGEQPTWVVDMATTGRTVCLRAVDRLPGELVLTVGSATLSIPLPAPSDP